MSTTAGQIVHIVLFKWTESATPEEIDRALAGLRGLEQKIAGILELSAGLNFSDRGKGYTHALLVRFSDRDALDAYIPHPEHQTVVQNLILPIRADILAIDYSL